MTNLKQWRERRQLTQARLADALRVDVRTVGRWEQTGKYPRWLPASLAALSPVGTPRQGRKERRRRGR